MLLRAVAFRIFKNMATLLRAVTFRIFKKYGNINGNISNDFPNKLFEMSY